MGFVVFRKYLEVFFITEMETLAGEDGEVVLQGAQPSKLWFVQGREKASKGHGRDVPCLGEEKRGSWGAGRMQGALLCGVGIKVLVCW